MLCLYDHKIYDRINQILLPAVIIGIARSNLLRKEIQPGYHPLMTRKRTEKVRARQHRNTDIGIKIFQDFKVLKFFSGIEKINDFFQYTKRLVRCQAIEEQ